jgi:fructose-1-phosphate kinase PfkB-like protein
MILVFAPFPALERVAMTERFVPGEPQKPLRVSTFAGGPGLRAASVIRLLGGEALVVGSAGGRIGELLADALDKQDIPHVLTRTASETRGGFLLLDREAGVVTLIPENPPVIADRESTKLLSSFDRHLVSASHALITGDDDGESGLLTAAMENARRASVPIIADLKGESLTAGLKVGGIFLLRVSHKSLQRHLERSLIHDSAIVRAAEELRSKHGVGHVVVTLGEDGAILSNETGATRVHAPVVSHFNPTGGGQTLVGAMTARLIQNGGDMVDALRWGCASASVNVTYDEPGYATPAEVLILLPKTTAIPVQTR